jgi:hypothetical protein
MKAALAAEMGSELVRGVVAHATAGLAQLLTQRDARLLWKGVRSGVFPRQVFLHYYREGERTPWHRDIDVSWGTVVVVLQQSSRTSQFLLSREPTLTEPIEHTRVLLECGSCITFVRNLSHCVPAPKGTRVVLVLWL